MNLTLIAQYKSDERHARKLAANGLALLLQSISARAKIASDPAYATLYAEQNAKLPDGADVAIAQMETLTNQLHALMWQLHTSYSAIEPTGNLFPGIEPPDA